MEESTPGKRPVPLAFPSIDHDERALIRSSQKFLLIVAIPIGVVALFGIATIIGFGFLVATDDSLFWPRFTSISLLVWFISSMATLIAFSLAPQSDLSARESL